MIHTPTRRYRCSDCGRCGHKYVTCPERAEGRQRCRTCASTTHRSGVCPHGSPLVVPPMRRCPKCWAVTFTTEQHVCGKRRRMDIPWRKEEYV